MPTNPLNDMFSLQHRLERLASALEDVNNRIARLTQSLHLNLSSSGQLHHVLQLDQAEANRHRQQRLQELRGLLVIRYDMIAHYAAALGRDATCSLLLYAQQRLLDEGFDPEVSGADIRHLAGQA